MGLIIGFSLALIMLLVCSIDDDHEKETIDQDHFIKNPDAPIEMDRAIPENIGNYTDMFGHEQEWMGGHISHTNEAVIGYYYALHPDEFWKYHMDNDFNRKWLKHYVDKFGSDLE